MPVTPDSLFGLQQLGESVALFEEEALPLRLQNDVFAPEECYGDIYRFDREDFEMSLAPFVAGRSTSSKAVKTQNKKVELISIAHIRTHKVLPAAQLFTMRTPGELSDNATAEVMKVREGLRRRVKLTIERICKMALTGTVTINASNFPDSDGAITITRTTTALSPLSASWATTSTKILSNDVRKWRRQVQRASGFKPTWAIFPNDITEYLITNAEIQAFITQTQRGVNVFETQMLGKAGGLESWEEYDGFYIPEGGSATSFIDATEFFLLPEPSMLKRVCRLIQGFCEVPVQAIGAGGGGDAVAGATKASTPGICEYAVPIQDGDPAGVKIHCDWYGMAVVKLPEAVGYRSNVTA